MPALGQHLIFDIAALALGAAAGALVYRVAFPSDYKHPALDGYSHYLFTLSLGSLIGASLLGTLNLWISDVPGLGRSVLGAILGAIAAVEMYKARHGIRRSTGAALVVPLGVGIAVGRLGCFLAGLDDYTYGTATELSWGVDFGDGVMRHPVQLYESLSMLVAAGAFLILLWRRPSLAMSSGFYLFIAWYAVERFAFEFIKPYTSVLGSLNVFHLACIVLLAYALMMLNGVKRARA